MYTELEEVRVVSKSDMTDFCRRFKLEPLVKDLKGGGGTADEIRKRATVDDECPKCGNKGLEFYTMQVRGCVLVWASVCLCASMCVCINVWKGT